MKRTFTKYPNNYVKASDNHATSMGYSSIGERYVTINDLRYKYNVLDIFNSFTIFINDSIGEVGTFKLDEIPNEYTDMPVRNISSRDNTVVFVIDNPDR